MVDQLRSALVSDEEASLAARAAWLYFAGGQTQAEVARSGSTSPIQGSSSDRAGKPRRTDQGFRRGSIAGCVGLEEQLKAQYGLGHCEVVRTLMKAAAAAHAGYAGARYLRNILDHREHKVIAVGMGARSRRRSISSPLGRQPTSASYPSSAA